MNNFGWDYPPGADNDPYAPWNADDMGVACGATYGDDNLPCELEAGHEGKHRTTDTEARGGFHTFKWGDD